MTSSQKPSSKASAINFLTVLPVKVMDAADNERSSSEDRFAMLSPLLRQASSASLTARKEGEKPAAGKGEDRECLAEGQYPGTT